MAVVKGIFRITKAVGFVTLVVFPEALRKITLPGMLNIVPVSSLLPSPFEGPETISCPLCRRSFAEEAEKRHHLDENHAGWALAMMSKWLRLIPRENG